MMRCRWGLIGAGNIANKFAADLKFSRNGHVYAVAARDLQRAKNFANTYGCEKYYGDYQALLNDSNVDAVYIALTHNFHYEWAKASLESGKHVLLEKPFTINTKQAASLFAIAEKQNKFIMEALWTKFHPTVKRAIELCKQGVIGELSHISASFGSQVAYDSSSRLFDPALGGGVLLDMGIYPLLLPLWLWGKPREWQGSVIKADNGVDVEFAIKAFWAGNRSADLSSSLITKLKGEANIIGSKGSLRIPHLWFATNQLILESSGEEQTLEVEFAGGGLQFQADAAVDCIASDLLQSKQHSWDDTLQMMQWLDEIRNEWGVSYPADSV